MRYHLLDFGESSDGPTVKDTYRDPRLLCPLPTLRPSLCHRTRTNISRHDTPLPRCAPTVVSHIRREPEAETKDVAEASEAAAAEQQKQQSPRTGQRAGSRRLRRSGYEQTAVILRYVGRTLTRSRTTDGM